VARLAPRHLRKKESIKMSLNLILQKVAFLHLTINPDWVDGNPGQPGPIFRTAIADYVVAGLLRDISRLLPAKEAAGNIRAIGKELAAAASGGLVAGWEDGDDLCPPYPFPFPHPWQFVVTPQQESLKVEHFGPEMTNIVLAYALRQLASLTSNERASTAIQQAGQEIVKGAGSRLFDEYCGTPVKPHVQLKASTAA
jgi:hypothetical protein